MFARLVLLGLFMGMLGGCAQSPAPSLTVREEPFTPELAKAALITLSQAGNEELRLAGTTDQLIQLGLKPANDGWFDLGARLRVHPADGTYVLNDFPNEVDGERFCYSTYEGKFVRDGDRWVARAPVFVRTTMMVGQPGE